MKSPELLQLPLEQALTGLGHRFVHDTATGIDPVERAVRLGQRHEPIGYDALVVALGGVDATRGVAGVTDHAHPFKSVEDCRIPGATTRAGRAVHELMVPTLTSPRALLRQANLRLL